MKNNWQTKKLGEICTVDWGNTNLTKKSYIENGKYLAVSAAGCDGRIEHAEHKKFTPVLSAIGAQCGRMFFPREDFTAIKNTITLTPKKDTVSNKFLFHLLNFVTLPKRGAGQPFISKGDIEGFSIVIPGDIHEQNRISEILDEVFENIDRAKENTEKNLQNSKELFENYLQNMFANNKWNKLTLKEISSMFGRGKSKHRPRNDKKLYGGIFPFIQTGDIRNSNHYITKYSQTYNETGLAQSKLWPTGTICITIAANIAETGILTFDACFPDSVIGIVANPKIALNEYVEYLLESFRSFIQSKGKGSAQANINMTTFENERFPFPDIKLQKVIVKKLDKLSEQTKKLEESYKKKLLLLDELKKSVLQKAFSGNL